MADRTIKIIANPDLTHRVCIFRRADGKFSFRWDEWTRTSWSPLVIGAAYGSAASAEREARSRVVAVWS
jgi:hypothetical protein